MWSHAGWSNTGYATSWLLMFRRVCTTTAASPLTSSGALKPDWRELLIHYHDRIMIGSDVKYWDENEPDEIADYMEVIDEMPRQIPRAAAHAVRGGTASDVFER